MTNSPDPEVARTDRERWWRYALVVLATVYVALLLVRLLAEVLGGFAQIVLILFTAWLLAFVLAPVVAWLHERWRVPRAVAIAWVFAATLFGGAFVLLFAFSSITESMADLTQNYPETRERIEETLRGWESAVASGSFELSFVELYRDGEAAATRIAASALGDVPQLTIAIFGSLVLVIILSLYMLADSARIIAKLKRVIPARYADEVDIVERTTSRAFGGFL